MLTMNTRTARGVFTMVLLVSALLTPGVPGHAQSDDQGGSIGARQELRGVPVGDWGDTAQQLPNKTGPEKVYRNAWGINLLVSDGGFGMGTFYRREFTPDLAGFIDLSVSESKDDQEIDQYDPYTGASFAPGKLNRFLVLPLVFGVQYRLFREEIVDNFRPYINAGAGPAMIYVMPYSNYVNGYAEPVDFFKAIGLGQPLYTASAFIGAGANFGTDRSNLFGVNFRYFITYPLSQPQPSLIDIRTGEVLKTKETFGGFYITLNFGMAY